MKLIPNFAQLLHQVKLPKPEKCFILEIGDEKYIKEWIENGEISCDLDKLFEWINVKYKLKKKNLNKEEKKIAEEVTKRFPVDQWRVIKIFSDHQRKYRSYKKTIEDIKSKKTSHMNKQAKISIFSPEWGINT